MRVHVHACAHVPPLLLIICEVHFGPLIFLEVQRPTGSTAPGLLVLTGLRWSASAVEKRLCLPAASRWVHASRLWK